MKDLKSILNTPINLPVQNSGSNIKYDNSRLWFAAFVPLLSLFIEMYANCIALGVLVWVCCILSWTAACLLDRRYLMQNDVDVSELSPATAVLPPLYIFKRVTITGNQNTAAIVFICFAFYAACANGFSQGIAMDEDKMISQIKDNYWRNITNVSSVKGADSTTLIGDTIDDLPESLGAKGKAKWTAKCKKNSSFGKKDYKRVTVTVKRGDLTLKFEAFFDGFTYTELDAVYYSDGTNSAFYKDGADNTVFKKYIETLINASGKKSDTKEESKAAADVDEKSEDSAEEDKAA